MPALTLKRIPPDIHKAIRQEQKKIKEEKDVRVYSLDLTIYHMIRELLKCREASK